MAEDLEITGATAGDISYVVAYYDVTTNNLYNANGQLYGNSTFSTTLGNEFILELHYVQDISTSENPEEWAVWDGLKDMTVSSTVAFDDNYVHAVEGSVAENTSAGSPTVRIHVPEISKDVLSSSGTLVFNPFGIEPENAQPNETRPVKQIVSYNAFNFISDDIFEFTIEDAQGLPLDVVGGDNATPVRVSDPLYLFVGTDAIYENNIPDRYEQGVFKIPMNINSRKLLRALDYSGASGVSGTMEHNIYVERNILSGIVVSGSTFSRNSDGDAVAKDLSDSNTYVFCDWISGSTSYWTRGKDVDAGTPLYTVSGGTATLTGSTTSPVYDTDSVLFRTFAFPFIVKNLVDYGNSITIPVENTDWTKDYIISIIRNNMEIVVGKASAGNYGTVLIGSNIDVDNGVISVKTASDENLGLVEISHTISNQEENVATPRVPTVKTVYDALALKQDNLTCDTTTGIEIVSGTTVKNDIATVAEVLTGATGTNIVDSDGLTGALSLGQANDVSCAPYNNSGTITYTDNEKGFLSGFTCSMVSGTSVGFYDSTDHKFPKFAPNRKYLMIADVSGSGTITPNGGSAVILSNTPQRISMVVTANNTGYFSASASATVVVNNWRQYAVTGMSNDAIDYLASKTTNDDPDALFRSTNLNSVLSRYLIKQNMVAPWMNVIKIDDNSNMTVAAGSNYKITYTDDSEHTVSVDTFPNDAYGWDSHIQMFVKGASNVKFKSPLILMNALTSNAGHNLVVKYRNGQALVYVEDTDAGNIVISTSGSTAGTLNYYLTQDPGTGHENYIVFGAVTDGAVCDGGTVTVSYNTNVIGNGVDKTTITGTYNVASGKTMNLQDLAVSGSTLFNNIYASNVVAINTLFKSTSGIITPPIFDGVTIPVGSTVTYDNTANIVYYVIRNINIDGQLNVIGRIYTQGSFAISGSGILKLDSNGLFTHYGLTGTYTAEISGITITNNHDLGYNTNFTIEQGFTYKFNDCLFTNNTGFDYPCFIARYTGVAELNNCIITGNTQRDAAAMVGNGGRLRMTNCTLGPQQRIRCEGTSNTPSYAILDGTLPIQGSFMQFGGDSSVFYLTIESDSLLKFTDNTYDYPITILGNVSIGDNITIVRADGKEAVIDACTFINKISKNAYITAQPNKDIVITSSTANPWRAINVLFESPLDAHEASTVKLSGTTFTSASKIEREPMRIQLPASTTVSVRGNSAPNATDKIITAPIIVVGDNASAPSGNATIEYGTNNTSTISGIGTYIAKDGSNDFVANNFINVVAVDGSTTGAKYLGTVLSATTGDTGANRFAKIDSGAVAVVNESVNAVNKQIITHDYEPIIGGTFSLTSATVSDATKTVAIQSGGTMSITRVTGGGDSIDLGRTNVIVTQNMAASGVAFTNGNGSATYYGGALFISAYNKVFSANIHDCLFSGNSATTGAAIGVITAGATVVLTGCTISGNSAGVTWRCGGLFTANGSITIDGCVFSDNYGLDCEFSNGNVDIKGSTIGDATVTTADITLEGSNRIGTISGTSTGTVTISSGAIVDLTGNTNTPAINPGGGITFAQGGVTIYPSAGSASAVTISGGKFASISSDGTLNAPVGYPDGNLTISGNATVNLNGSNSMVFYYNGITLAGLTIKGYSYTGDGGRGAIVIGDSNQVITASGCTFTQNFATYGGVAYVGASATLRMSGCVVSGNSGTHPIYLQSGTLIASDCTFADRISVQAEGTVKLEGTNSIRAIYPIFEGQVGYVTISSGAIVNLAASINPGGTSRITVMTGGCTINSKFVSANTYSSIVSSGGNLYVDGTIVS